MWFSTAMLVCQRVCIVSHLPGMTSSGFALLWYSWVLDVSLPNCFSFMSKNQTPTEKCCLFCRHPRLAPHSAMSFDLGPIQLVYPPPNIIYIYINKCQPSQTLMKELFTYPYVYIYIIIYIYISSHLPTHICVYIYSVYIYSVYIYSVYIYSVYIYSVYITVTLSKLRRFVFFWWRIVAHLQDRSGLLSSPRNFILQHEAICGRDLRVGKHGRFMVKPMRRETMVFFHIFSGASSHLAMYSTLAWKVNGLMMGWCWTFRMGNVSYPDILNRWMCVL